MQVIQDNWVLIVGALLGLSEVLALLPGVKSNSIFQFIVNALKSIAPKKEEAKKDAVKEEK